MRNEYEIRGDHVAIFLERKDGTRLVALIDVGDLERATDHTWHAAWDPSCNRFYVLTNVRVAGKHSSLSLHRHLLGDTGTAVIDHGDQDGLNNRRYNLRPCSESLNRHNSSDLAPRNTRSGYRSVIWSTRHSRWLARKRIDKKTFYLGLYHDPAEANKAVLKFLETRGLTKWQQPRSLQKQN